MKNGSAGPFETKNILIEHPYGDQAVNPERIFADLETDRLEPYVYDVDELLYQARNRVEQILLEDQLGALRDPDHGIHPYPTPSSPLAGFGSVGAGIPPHKIQEIAAVTKAYSSCFGAGPFITELEVNEAAELRRRGGGRGRIRRHDRTPSACRLV